MSGDEVGSFWDNATPSQRHQSELEALFEQETPPLEDVLCANDTIQELRAGNRKLLD